MEKGWSTHKWPWVGKHSSEIQLQWNMHVRVNRYKHQIDEIIFSFFLMLPVVYFWSFLFLFAVKGEGIHFWGEGFFSYSQCYGHDEDI